MTFADQPDPDPLSDTELAVTGFGSRDELSGWTRTAVAQLTGESVDRVLFRSGRIDAVYGIRTDAGDRLLKVHRPPVDLAARRLAVRVQTLLAETGFPCPRPLAGPAEVDGRTVSVETLLPAGEEGDGHDPRIRQAMAAGLARQVEVLAAHPDLAALVGAPPAWCDYRHGAWGRTHDSIFDFTVTPPAYAWLQAYAQQASDQLQAWRPQRPPVVAHGDWYSGNLRFEGATLVAAFDWDLIADQEAVIVGIAAATFAGESPDAGPTTPPESAAFMADYEAARSRRFSDTEREAATAAMRWNLAYSARCDVTNRAGEPSAPGSALRLLEERRAEYLELTW